MIRTDDLRGDAGEPGHPGESGGAGGAGGAGGEPGGQGGAGGAGGRGGDADNGISDLRHIAEQSQTRGQMVNYITAAILLFLTGWFLLAWWQGQQAIKIESIKVNDIQILSESELCPGDTLITGYALRIEGLGTVAFHDSVYREGYPVKFSDGGELIVQGPRTLIMEDHWVIPARPDRRIAWLREWVPGRYTRQISVAPDNSYVSRFVEPGVLEVSFSMKDNCP